MFSLQDHYHPLYVISLINRSNWSSIHNSPFKLDHLQSPVQSPALNGHTRTSILHATLLAMIFFMREQSPMKEPSIVFSALIDWIRGGCRFIAHFNSMRFAWKTGSASGQWTIVPGQHSPLPRDHCGQWEYVPLLIRSSSVTGELIREGFYSCISQCTWIACCIHLTISSRCTLNSHSLGIA